MVKQYVGLMHVCAPDAGICHTCLAESAGRLIFDLMTIGQLYRAIPHVCQLTLHSAETKALPHDGALALDNMVFIHLLVC